MRVAINALSLRPGGGGAVRHGVELLGALARRHPELRLTVFISRDAPPELRRADWADAVRWVRLPLEAAGRANALAQLAGLAPLAVARRADVLHSLAGVGPPRVPGLLATVVTLPDVIWLRLPDQVSMTAAQRAAWVRQTRPATRWSTRVITVSESSKRDIADAYNIDPDRIDVTPLGARLPNVRPAAGDVRERLGIGPGRMLLCVGQQQPYKAQAELIRAVAQLGEPDVQLALPGPPTAYGDELRRLAAELGIADRVHLLGFVAEEDIEALYMEALAVVQPSRMEGFGLPALEALARGKPLACSGRSALGEVAGDAALTFDPDEVDSIAAALRRLLDDEALRADLARRGPARAAEFTWEATADATVASYRRAVGVG
jgi:glycosyltransferase involved in cell wall biosynthesis